MANNPLSLHKSPSDAAFLHRIDTFHPNLVQPIRFSVNMLDSLTFMRLVKRQQLNHKSIVRLNVLNKNGQQSNAIHKLCSLYFGAIAQKASNANANAKLCTYIYWTAPGSGQSIELAIDYRMTD